MPSSQFTIYTAADPYGPGYMHGNSGSLVSILNACLVNGYTGKPAAGWTKPLPDVSGVYACYKQATGSNMTLFINDNGPNVTSLGSEAWAVGWESMTSLTSGSANTNNGVGTTSFPTPIQSLSGHVVWKKSNTIDNTTNRYWILAADSSSMYLWVQTGDNSATAYYHASFGDCYSLVGSSDKWKCYIMGRYVENTTNIGGVDWTDGLPTTTDPYYSSNGLSTPQPGHYLARTAWGGGTSLSFAKRGDSGVTQGYANTSFPICAQINGVLGCPNSSDGQLYMCPLWLAEPGVLLRGRFRGLYQVGHPSTMFSDGQVIQGANDYAGKTFMIVHQSYYGSYWALEISNTVETN